MENMLREMMWEKHGFNETINEEQPISHENKKKLEEKIQ